MESAVSGSELHSLLHVVGVALTRLIPLPKSLCLISDLTIINLRFWTKLEDRESKLVRRFVFDDHQELAAVVVVTLANADLIRLPWLRNWGQVTRRVGSPLLKVLFLSVSECDWLWNETLRLW